MGHALHKTGEGGFKNGQEDGEWNFYNDEGELEFYGNYEEGDKKGDWFRITKNGKRKAIKH